MLEPLLAEIEEFLTDGFRRESYSSDSSDAQGLDADVITWSAASLTDLPELVCLACSTLAARGERFNIGTPGSIKEATSAMMLVLHAICVAGEKLEVSNSHTEFPQSILLSHFAVYAKVLMCTQEARVLEWQQMSLFWSDLLNQDLDSLTQDTVESNQVSSTSD